MSTRPPWIRSAAVLSRSACLSIVRPMLDPTARFLILILAGGIEAVLAYPAPVFRAIGHPVSWIGALILALGSKLNRPDFSDRMRRVTGVATVLVLLVVGLIAGLALEIIARLVPYIGFVIPVVAVA